ncbi:hypothetical protein [Phaffia rhodozyma]|uniref:Uncharacterized protein n=1 Tax=Phaffia rhodozyma TaxID=264483 RepID=A0A0F7SVZ1_PHARH|nr:hypothetical protein [Phaffia rhodozyma]
MHTHTHTHTVERLPSNILSSIQLAIGTTHPTALRDHLAWSRSHPILRAFYQPWWERQINNSGWGLPNPAPPSPVHALCYYLHHQTTCAVQVLRPWAYEDDAASPGSSRKKIPDDRGEWIALCWSTHSPEKYGIWPPLSKSGQTITPNPLLSDTFLPLTPPPPAWTHPALSLPTHQAHTTSPLSRHPTYAHQLASFPARAELEVLFLWGTPSDHSLDHHKTLPAGQAEWEKGRALVRVNRQDGRPITVRDLWQAILDFWTSPLGWQETKRLHDRFPHLDTYLSSDRPTKGEMNGRLTKIQRDNQRWAWLGNYNVFTGLLSAIPSPASSSTPRDRFVAWLITPSELARFHDQGEAEQLAVGSKRKAQDDAEADLDLDLDLDLDNSKDKGKGRKENSGPTRSRPRTQMQPQAQPQAHSKPKAQVHVGDQIWRRIDSTTDEAVSGLY